MSRFHSGYGTFVPYWESVRTLPKNIYGYGTGISVPYMSLISP